MSLYEQSVPAYIRHLEQFRGILEKASKYADENKKDHDEMLKYRLISDMQGYGFTPFPPFPADSKPETSTLLPTRH